MPVTTRAMSKKLSIPKTHLSKNTKTPPQLSSISANIYDNCSDNDLFNGYDSDDNTEPKYWLKFKNPVKEYILATISAKKEANFDHLVEIIDKTNMFAKYRYDAGSYCGIFFAIPVDIWLNKTKLTLEQTIEFDDLFEPFYGSIRFDKCDSDCKVYISVFD